MKQWTVSKLHGVTTYQIISFILTAVKILKQTGTYFKKINQIY
jgi:hypothetical protein